jgi:hypothetical protein
VPSRDFWYPPIDDAGRDLRVDDWVRLVKIPDLNGTPPETHDVFNRALGKTFRIEFFDRARLSRSHKESCEPSFDLCRAFPVAPDPTDDVNILAIRPASREASLRS